MKGMKSILKLSFWGRFPITVAVLWGACVYGQAYSISGRAFNEAGKKIGPVRIVLYDLDKRKVIELETPTSGKFKLKNIPKWNPPTINDIDLEEVKSLFDPHVEPLNI